MNNYYTPTAEEFHIGFKYELIFKNSREGEEEYLECIYDGEYNLADLNYKIRHEKVRVKYLNKEDIESLGFVMIVEKNEKHFYFTDPEFPECKLLRLTFYNEIPEVLIFSRFETNNSTSFSGYVKNKSELKRILKQIEWQ